MRVPDLTLALRNLRRRPAFTATAILLLALGAGANAAVFSVVRGILLRPLPYQEPERLVAIWPGSFVTNDDLTFWRQRTRSFEAIAANSPGWMMSLVVPGQEPIKVTGGRTSGNFFTTLGVRAALGRVIQPGDAIPSATRALVLSGTTHQRLFAGDANVIGRRVFLDNVEHEVVGVLPGGFEFLEPGTDVWAAMPFDPASAQNRAQFSMPFARLRAGVPIEHAHAELQQLVPAMREELKKTSDWGRTGNVVLLQDYVTGDVRSTLLILLAAVGLILLLAAVNLGTLVLGRAIERAREIALRTALGASRWRLLRQLIVEQAVLASAGALVGLLIARLLLPVLVTRIPPEMPRQGEIAFDTTVFLTVFVVTVGVAVLMALLPAIATTRADLQPLLRQTQRSETPARRRALGSLVAAQIALAVILGVGAGLMLRSLWNLQQVDPGFNANGVLTFRLQTTSKPMNLTQGLVYFEQVLERIRALPEVQTVGAIQHLPMSGYNWTANVWRTEAPPAPGAERPQAIWRFVGWDYFQAMQIPVVAGRHFSDADRVKAPPVAIINEALARREFGAVDAALGRRLTSYSAGGEQATTVVGIIRDVRFFALDKPAEPEIYRPLAQTFMFPMAFVVRTAGEPSRIAAAVRQAAFGVDPMIAVAEMQPLTQLVAGTLGRPRLLATLLMVFAAVGLTLGVIGVYGVVAYRVRQQEREFGIRVALGAAPDRITLGVFRQGALYAALGLILGVPLAIALSRLMSSVVFGITTSDPLTFAIVPLLIVAATLLACAVPARRAARVNPVTTMKAE